MNEYEERLYKEWKTYGKIMIAADWDSTIDHWPTLNNDDDRAKAIDLLQVAHNTGAYITIFTCSKPERYPEIQKKCEELRIPIDGINTNPIPLPYGNHGKIYYNILLDDRAGFVEAMKQLEVVMYKIRGEQAAKLTEGETI